MKRIKFSVIFLGLFFAALFAENIIFLGIACLALGMGWFLLYFPEETFKIQQRFYRLINWHIEPIDFKKEMRNTRVMGLILICVVILSYFYLFITRNSANPLINFF